jgi:hypothetical protein
MNTKKSDAQVKAFQKRSFKAQRRTLTLEREIPCRAEAIFPLLCPSRECDWVPGWASDLVYTDTGYIQEDCVFSTNDANSFGPGIWVCCRHEQNRRAEFVRLMEHIVFQLKISLEPVGENSTRVVWRILLTGLDAEGNQQLAAAPNLEARFQVAIDALVHYLDSGEMMTVPHGG